MNLENVQKLKLGPIKIDGIPNWKQPYKDWYYTSKPEINSFKLTINNEDYPLPNSKPINETFVLPSVWRNNIIEQIIMEVLIIIVYGISWKIVC